MSTIAEKITEVEARISAAALTVQRDVTSIHLLAISKNMPAAALRVAYAAGIRDFGENYLQEARAKQVELADLTLIWHFVGPIQSNKTRDIAENFSWVHSVDRLKIAQHLSEKRPAELAPLNIFIQVNVSGEASKSGCITADLPALAAAINYLPRLKLRGLMAIPEPTENRVEQDAVFTTVRNLQKDLNMELDKLSMGMSNDLESAIAQGSTCVRIGTALFGTRDYDTV